MTEPERDALYARVLATPDGRRLLDDIAAQDILGFRFADQARERIARMRKRWETGGSHGPS